MFAQQDPQFTQYMYNTQVVNPGYAGSRDILSVGVLGRYQWVNIEGAPRTYTFTLNSPMGLMNKSGIGLSIVHDQLGIVKDTNINIDYSYRLYLSNETKLAFGLKAGLDLFNVDYSALNTNTTTPDNLLQNNIDNSLLPQIGAGLYLYSNKWYVGLSVPNFLETNHYKTSDVEAKEKMHFFGIAGYVFDLGETVKFKPATLFKAVEGTPLQVDLSANFLLKEKLTLGAAYRWDAAVSALAGFQISDSIFAGMAYDYDTTILNDYSGGSYEIILRFDLVTRTVKAISPRFF